MPDPTDSPQQSGVRTFDSLIFDCVHCGFWRGNTQPSIELALRLTDNFNPGRFAGCS